MMKPTSLFQNLTTNTRRIFRRQKEPLPPPIRLEEDGYRQILMVITDGEVSYIPIEANCILIDSDKMSEHVYQLEKKLKAVGDEFYAFRIAYDMPYTSTHTKHKLEKEKAFEGEMMATFDEFCNRFEVEANHPESRTFYRNWCDLKERLAEMEEAFCDGCLQRVLHPLRPRRQRSS